MSHSLFNATSRERSRTCAAGANQTVRWSADNAAEFLARRRASFPANPRADAAAGPRAARDGYADHRPSRPGIRQARQALPRRHQDHLQDHQSGDHLHRDRHRRLGSGAGQHAVARRPRADGRDRPVRDAMEEHGAQARAQSPNSSRATGAPAPTPPPSRSTCARTRRTRSRRSACCTTRPRPAACRRSSRSARRSTPPAIRRCSWSTPSPRSPRPIIATTNGASTSPSAARRRA